MAASIHSSPYYLQEPWSLCHRLSNMAYHAIQQVREFKSIPVLICRWGLWTSEIGGHLFLWQKLGLESTCWLQSLYSSPLHLAVLSKSVNVSSWTQQWTYVFFTTTLDDYLTKEETEAQKGKACLRSLVGLGFCTSSVFPPDHGSYKEWGTWMEELRSISPER